MRPAEDVERLGVADGAHGLLVHRDEVVARLDAAVARKRAARRHRPGRGWMNQERDDHTPARGIVALMQPKGLLSSPGASGNYGSTFPHR